jgi:4-amino-4-deoxy-L-arabinose transferase-like glycosyltransferase
MTNTFFNGKTSKLIAILAGIFGIVFLVLLIILHFLNPQIDPSTIMIGGRKILAQYSMVR